jgi:hypothetical protein
LSFSTLHDVKPTQESEGSQNHSANVLALVTKPQYTKLRDQWLDFIRKGSKEEVQLPAALVQYPKFEEFADIVQSEQAIALSSSSSVFGLIEYPLHVARVAFEHGDTDTIQRIQQAIKMRWINILRQERLAVHTVTNCINSMFEDATDESTKLQEQYPDIFRSEVPESTSLEDLDDTYIWSELLSLGDGAPNLDEPGVTYEDGDMRVTIGKDGKEWVHPKTSARVS